MLKIIHRSGKSYIGFQEWTELNVENYPNFGKKKLQLPIQDSPVLRNGGHIINGLQYICNSQIGTLNWQVIYLEEK